MGAESLRFDSLAGQIGTVANGSPPALRRFCVARVLSRGNRPQWRTQGRRGDRDSATPPPDDCRKNNFSFLKRTDFSSFIHSLVIYWRKEKKKKTHRSKIQT